MDEAVIHYIHQLHQDDSEHAEHWLMEADPTVVSTLLAAYLMNTQPTFRVKLLNIIRSHRIPDTLPFFATVLQADDPHLWKAALDGIVTIKHPDGVTILQAERARLLQLADQTIQRLEWIDEAIRQLTESEHHE